MSQGGTGELNQEQLERLASYFDEEAYRLETTKLPEVRFRALLNGGNAERLELVRA